MTDRHPSGSPSTLGSSASGALRNVDIEQARVELRRAQTALAALGYEVGDHGDPAQAIDGIWGERTQRAVLDFQGDRELPRTGQLDSETMAALLATETDAMELESSTTGDEVPGREVVQQVMHADDRETMGEVLDDMQPSDTEEEWLQ